jgi:hypothetical protein
MAPEVANGRYGKEIDIYALGVVLFEMLTGRVPFEGESVGEVLMKHLTAAPDVSVLVEPFRSVVARALEKDPARRFGSVAEMLAALPRPSQAQVRVAWSAALPGGKGDSPHLPDSFSPSPTSTGAERARAAAPPPVVEVVDEEPISAAVRRACRSVQKNWNESNLHASTKLVLIILVLLVAAGTMHTWAGIAILLAVLYGCYRATRAIVRSMTAKRSAGYAGMPPPPPFPGERGDSPHGCEAPSGPFRQMGTVPLFPAGVPVARPAPPPRAARWVQRESAVLASLAQSPRQRLAGLLGSLVGSALAAFTMCLVLAILESFHGPSPTPAQFAWLVVVSVTGSWAVLVPSKFWEGGRGEPMLRRFVLMVIGLGVGLVSFATAVHLKVDLPHDRGFGEIGYNLPAAFYGSDGSPLLAAHVAALGTLFLVLRWWRQADPLRSTRLSVWAMIVGALAAWLIAAVWLFPQPWLAMVACAMSASVQLAGRWLNPHARHVAAGKA